jgi:hypothetical protein
LLKNSELRSFVAGHDFTACEKNTLTRGFVKGHGFSRADKFLKINRASAPAMPNCPRIWPIGDFFRKLFSRVDKANQIRWSSAPEGLKTGAESPQELLFQQEKFP